MTAKSAPAEAATEALVLVVPVPGLHFEPREVPADEAAELVASGSFQYPEPEATAPAPEQPAAPAEG